MKISQLLGVGVDLMTLEKAGTLKCGKMKEITMIRDVNMQI
jgi:hypothetical protein